MQVQWHSTMMYSIPYTRQVPNEDLKILNKYLNYLISGALEPARPPDFGRLVHPIPTRGADYAYQFSNCQPDLETCRRLWI